MSASSSLTSRPDDLRRECLWDSGCWAPAQVRSSRCCCAVLPGGTGSSGYSYLSSSSEKRQASAISTRARDRFGEAGEQPRHLRRRLEMPLGIDRQPEAGFGDRAFLADAGEHVGKRPAFRHVIEHVVDGDERRAACARRARRAGGAGAARRRDSDGRRQEKCAPARRARARQPLGEDGVEAVRRQHDEHLAFAGGQDVLEGEMAFAFLRLEIACVRRRQSRP